MTQFSTGFAPQDETRTDSRKPFRSRARVGLADGSQLDGRAVDISVSGICVMVGNALPAGQNCMIFFETVIGGMQRKVEAPAKVVYNIYGSAGFRTGFRFVDLSPNNSVVVNWLLNN